MSSLRPPEAWALAGIGLLAVALRLFGNGFGLPDTFEPDEPKLVNHALAFGLGDLNPHYFVYPAFQMYLLFGVFGALFVVLRLTGVVASVEGFKLLFLSDPTVFYRVGRGLTALFGLGVVLLVFLLARRLYGGSRVGLLAAFALAVHPVDVLHGHYITADVPMTFFLLLGLVFLAPALEEPSHRAFAWAGCAAGLATATKYSGLIFVLPVLAAAALGARRVAWPFLPKALAAFGLALAGAFFLASPFSVVEWRKTLDAMQFILDVKRDGQFGLARGASWGTYLNLAFFQSPLALASLLGVGWALWRRRAGDMLLLSLAVPYFLTVGSSQSHSARYLVPLFPLLMILAARALFELCEIPLAAGRSALWPRPLPALAFAVAVLVAFGQSAAQARELLLPDTRRAAREWIEREVPPDTAIALEWGGDDTVRLAESRESLEEKIRGYLEGTKQSDHQAPEQMVAALRLLQKAQMGRPGFRLVKLGRMQDNRLEGQGQDLDALRNLGVSYVVQSSAALGDARSEAFARAYPEAAAFYTRLEREARLVARFAAEKGRLRGPEIAIYRLSTGAALASAAATPEETRE